VASHQRIHDTGGPLGLWKRIEQAIWIGKPIRDYGPLADGTYGSVKRTLSAVLAHKDGRDRFLIKSSYRAFFSASVQYVEFDRDAAVKLKAALDDALTQMR